MSSNVTLRSNVYINLTARSDDKGFVQHITDYRILKRLRGNPYEFSPFTHLMTSGQLEILRQGQPNCSLEKGTMSWGIPMGGRHMVCRCEQRDCPRFSLCSKYANFQDVQREKADTPQGTVSARIVSPLPLYPDLLLSGDQRDPDIGKQDADAVVHSRVAEQADVSGIKQPEVQSASRDLLDEASSFVSVEPGLPVGKEVEPLIEIASAELTAHARIPETITTNPVTEVQIPVVEPTGSVTQRVSQKDIIEADTADRIWVNAGPGTGKTFVVIERLKKLLHEGINGTILVLCFSRNAVQVIRDRLDHAMGHTATALIEDGQLVIRTFDSFATYMLEDELNPAWDYNQRIDAFIHMIKAHEGSLNEMLGYLIVDEIQDTVGVRARMLLALLDELKCGVLLLGDSCQAIFDWTIRDTNDMPFSLLASNLAKRMFKRFELSENRRQSGELAQMALRLRETLLTGSEEEQEHSVNGFKEWVRKKWRPYTIKALPQVVSSDSDLILCKTNGEAAFVSQCMFETVTQVGHVMKQSSRHRSLAPWIAKLLYGNDGCFMSRADFMKNAEQFGVADPDKKWSALKLIDGHPHAPVLHIKEVLAALTRKDSLPEICLNQHQNDVIVSTVHRAKGSEAEHVYWLDSPLVFDGQGEQEGTLADSIRAAYVAATRAKTDIHMLAQEKRVYMRTISDTRWIQIGWGASKRPYCKGIALLPEDVDVTSFVKRGNAEAFQTILSCLEPGMPVTLYPNEDAGIFDIYFEGQQIGSTSIEFTMALFAGFEATNHNKNWPAYIPDVYISGVTTVVAPDNPRVEQSYGISGCWLGVELGGFPTISWYN